MAFEDSTAGLWQGKTGGLLYRFGGQSSGVVSAELTRQIDTIIATNGVDPETDTDVTASRWDVATGEMRATFSAYYINTLVTLVSSEGNSVVVVPPDRGLIWNVSLFTRPRAERMHLTCQPLRKAGLINFTPEEMRRDIRNSARLIDQAAPRNREGLLSWGWYSRMFIQWLG